MTTDDVVEVEVEVLVETEKALHVFVVDTGDEVWIPKSQIHDDSDVYSRDTSPGTITITRWIAEQKGIV